MEKTFFDSLSELDLATVLASAKEISNTSTKRYERPLELWLVHHLHKDCNYNWTCAFDSEQVAEDFLLEWMEMYSAQGAYITEDEYGEVYISKDEDATVVVKMYVESTLLNYKGCGTVRL